MKGLISEPGGGMKRKGPSYIARGGYRLPDTKYSIIGRAKR